MSFDCIEDYPLPSAEEERELIIKSQEGDKKSFDYLVIANSRLVNQIAKKFTNKGIDYEDLCQVGCMGLMKSIEKFDVSKNMRLSTYAFMWIQQYITRLIQDHSRTIRIPCHTYQKNFTLIVASKQLEQEIGRSATLEELAEFTNKSIKEIEQFNKSIIETFSINHICESGREATEMIADERIADIDTNIIGSEMVDIIRSVLTQIEFRVFMGRMGLYDKPKTFKEIAIECNFSSQRIQQIYRTCLEKLKRHRKIELYKCS